MHRRSSPHCHFSCLTRLDGTFNDTWKPSAFALLVHTSRKYLVSNTGTQTTALNFSNCRVSICGKTIQIKKIKPQPFSVLPSSQLAVDFLHRGSARCQTAGLALYSHAIINSANKTCPAAPSFGGQGCAACSIPQEGPAHTFQGDIPKFKQPRALGRRCQSCCRCPHGRSSRWHRSAPSGCSDTSTKGTGNGSSSYWFF